MEHCTWADARKSGGSISWAWEGWLPMGMLTLITGEHSIGKSALALRIAASFVRGDNWPDGTSYRGDTGCVLWCESDGTQAVHLERATTWGLPLDRLWSPLPDQLLPVSLYDDRHRGVIMALAREPYVRLVVVDSLQTACGRQEQLYVSATRFLAELAYFTGKPVLLTYHGMLHSDAIERITPVIWVLTPFIPASSWRRLACIKSPLRPISVSWDMTIGDGGVVFKPVLASP
jgi:hypothetical protein